jgi:hypothetical protein
MLPTPSIVSHKTPSTFHNLLIPTRQESAARKLSCDELFSEKQLDFIWISSEFSDLLQISQPYIDRLTIYSYIPFMIFVLVLSQIR